MKRLNPTKHRQFLAAATRISRQPTRTSPPLPDQDPPVRSVTKAAPAEEYELTPVSRRTTTMTVSRQATRIHHHPSQCHRNSDQDTRRRPSQRQRHSSAVDEPVQKEQAQGAGEGPLEGSRRASAARQTRDPPARAVPPSRWSTARTADEDPDAARRPSQAAKDASWVPSQQTGDEDRRSSAAARRPSEEQTSARRPSQVSRPADAGTQERGHEGTGRKRKGG